MVETANYTPLSKRASAADGVTMSQALSELNAVLSEFEQKGHFGEVEMKFRIHRGRVRDVVISKQRVIKPTEQVKVS